MADKLKTKVVLDGDAKGATKAIKKTEKGLKGLGGATKRLSLGMVAGFAAAAIAIRGLIKGIGASIKAMNVQEDAINALDGALARLGPSAQGVSKALQEQAAALQQMTRYGDEEIIQAQALIASFVSEEAQIKKATKAALDLAEAKGMSLKGAADLISKTLGSSTNAMSRYGIEVEGAVGSTERLASLTGNIEKVFGGRAQKAAETFSGKVQQLKNAFGDMQEEIGRGVTKNEEMIESIDKMRGNVEDLTPAMAELSEQMVTLGVDSVNALVNMGKAIGDAVLLFEGNDMASAMDDTAIATGVLETRAMELGITVEELQLQLKKTVHENHVLEASTKEVAVALESEAQAAERAAAAQKKLDDEAEATTSAMKKLGDALGIVTSAHLELEIAKISEALEEVRVTSGEFSQEYQYAAEIAEKKTDELKERIVGLRDGMGDVGEAVEVTAEKVEQFATATQEAGVQVVQMSTNLSKGITFLHNTAIAYDALTKKIGEAAAQQAVLASGMATLSQGGTRIRLAGGGSRLVNTTGRGSSSMSLSEFGTGGRTQVDADGKLRPA